VYGYKAKLAGSLQKTCGGIIGVAVGAGVGVGVDAGVGVGDGVMGKGFPQLLHS
jgi:hypothetical protein